MINLYKTLRIFCVLLCLLFFKQTQSQIITTVAGNGTVGYSGDGGPATSAQLSDMYYCYPAFDHLGNMYIAQTDANTIRKIDANGIITTIAGTIGVIGYSGDGGPANNALLYHPNSMAVDNQNNLYFGDANGDFIRKIDVNGIITTVSSYPPTTICGYGDGGPLSQAKFYATSGLTFDNQNNLYISDFGCNVVRKVDGITGIITTIAGNGTWGFSGDGGPATNASLAYPSKVGIDGFGNVYIADAQNHRIRKVDKITGIITTVVGTGVNGSTGDGGPATNAQLSFPGSVVVDNLNNLYIADNNQTIRKINTSGIITRYAGTGTWGYTGDGGPAINADIELTEGRISITDDQSICFVNYNSGDVIRKISNCLTSTISQQPQNITLCNSGNTSFFITAANVTSYQWQVNTGSGFVNINNGGFYSGANTSSLIVTGANTSMNNYQYRCMLTNSCGTISSINAILTVNALLTPSIIINTPTTNICSGTSATFSATIQNGGNSPNYQWKKNSVNVGINSSTYQDSALLNGDIIECFLVSNASCILTTNANSNTILMTVTNNVTPSINITSSNNNVCYGTPITFTSFIQNGGSNPNYQWKKNGINVGTNSSTYIDNAVNSGDIITCILQSNLQCVTSQTSNSSPLVMTILPSSTPSISIIASSNNSCIGLPINFTANVQNGGPSPSYQWKKNGINVGVNSLTYTDNSLANGDNINCILTANGNCLTSPQAVSNIISPIINNNPIVIFNNSNSICDGGKKTIDAGNFASYMWNTGENTRKIDIYNLGTYSVNIKDQNGCEGFGSTSITKLLPKPNSFLPKDTFICMYENINIKASANFLSYQWNQGSSSSFINVKNLGLYWLQVTDLNNCIGRDSINVFLKSNCIYGFNMPTGFTPNKDSKNDIIKPLIYGQLKKYKFTIFNRWSQVVFYSTNNAEGWDGNYRNVPQPLGGYTWFCNFQLEGGIEENLSGTFILVR